METNPFLLTGIYKFAVLDLKIRSICIFVGDSAHVSPFGARGGNGGIHDVDTLAGISRYHLAQQTKRC